MEEQSDEEEDDKEKDKAKGSKSHIGAPLEEESSYSDGVSDLYPATNKWGSSAEEERPQVEIKRLCVPPREKFMLQVVPEAISIAR